jgi:YHS domain-containing protein
MKRDLVCGMLVDPANALWLEYHGKTYYFCSHLCKQEFEDRPDEYVEHPSTMLDGIMFNPIRILATAVQEQKEPIGH